MPKVHAGMLPYIEDFIYQDGSLNGNWIGSTWSISNGQASNTPDGTQLIPDPTFDDELKWFLDQWQVSGGLYAQLAD